MTEKIEWYKEVLELEPNSKVFFPLARMLSETQRYDEAIEILEHGLERHPEFLEARLFFIELLHKTAKRTACTSQVAQLSKMFSIYAGFWQAWAACLSAAGDAPDTALVLRFLSAYFTNGSVSLHEVFDKGLNSMLGEPEQTAPVQAPVIMAAPPPAPPSQEAPAAALVTPTAAATAPSPPEQLVTSEDAFDEDQSIPTQIFTEPENAEEHFSLRTRSMAEVLAEQGDIQGALDIYHELLAGATNPEESVDLQRRITTLSTLLANSTVADKSVDTPVQPESSVSKDKLISMLETLAERVEARAQS